jgi:uncharacterized protein DUF3176
MATTTADSEAIAPTSPEAPPSPESPPEESNLVPVTYAIEPSRKDPESASASSRKEEFPAPSVSRLRRHQTLWRAIAYSLIIGICMAAAIAIVAASDKRDVSGWHVKPTVLLAIVSSVLNLALPAAETLGVAVAWWRASYRGAKLKTLHHIWQHGTGGNPLPALLGESSARKVLITTVVIGSIRFISSPLLQRATGVELQDQYTNETFKLDIAQRIPDGYAAKYRNDSTRSVVGSPKGLHIAQGWWGNSTILTSEQPGYSCNGTCAGTIPGAGLSLECSSSMSALNLTAPENDGAALCTINTTVIEEPTGHPYLKLMASYASSLSESCIATVTTDVCKLQAAVVQYPITIQGSSVYLNHDLLHNMTVLSTFISDGDLSTTPQGAGAGTLTGLSRIMGDDGQYLYANVTILQTAAKPLFHGPGTLPDMFYVTDSSMYSNYTNTKCNLLWRSPTNYTINSLHDFMFRSAIDAGKGMAQVFVAQRRSQVLVFKSNYAYLGAALVSILVALIVVWILFWGWWELEWHVSLSPLEVASAFRAPAMQSAGQNTSVREVLNRVGDIEVRYRRRTAEDVGGMVPVSDE